ncbi:MAG: hypothetical protein DRN04_08075 [Thermoprotei archaeon]|nr:MAG: hypothetical protein DRN04_08075 [Thermoprotei archaeon]
MGADDTSNEFEYKPRPVKAILKEMKNLSELMIDLAYYSALYGDVQLAEEVFKLEKRIDFLQMLLSMQAALATRSRSAAEKIVSIYAIATAANRVSDAAADIARMTVKKIKIPRDFALTVYGEEDFVATIKVPKELNGKSLAELFSETGVVVDVLIARRGTKIYLEPPENFRLRSGDILVVRGTFSNVRQFSKYFGVNITDREEVLEKKYKPIVNMLLSFKRISRVCVDLAYVAVLTRSEDIAKKVQELEEYTDLLLDQVSEEIFREKDLTLKERLGGLWIAIASEDIADAAAEMVEPLLKGLEPHPLLTDIIGKADERISVIEIDEKDHGRTLNQLKYSEKGIKILAVKRRDEWYVLPREDFEVCKGDILIIKYSAELEPLVEQLEHEEDREEIIEEIQEAEWEEEE